MDYYLTEDGYLMHYGIEGQKWGKRNGPPYPLSSSQASASEKKQGFRSKLSSSIERKRKATIPRNLRNRHISRHKAYVDSKNMTDSELKEANNRLNAEKQYRQLIEDDRRAFNNLGKNNAEKAMDMLVAGITGAVVGAGVKWVKDNYLTGGK